jgi:imidazolonepropionase-like amidohydrolase
MLRLLAALLAVGLSASAAQVRQATSSRDAAAVVRLDSAVVALTHVSVIDGTGAPARPEQTLIIESGHIRDVGNVANVPIPSTAKVFDLTGQSVLPGLVSLHDHINGQSSSAPELFLAAGVTTLRTAGGSEPYTDLNLKRRIDAGLIAGPELFVTGPFLNNEDRFRGSPFMKHVRNDDDARRAVRYWAAEGVTSIKVYRGITPALLRATAEEAHRLQLPVLGHLESTTCREAVEAGIDSIEHGFPSCVDLRNSKGDRITDPQSPEAVALLHFIIEHHVSITTTPVDLRPLTAAELDAMHPGFRAEYEHRSAAGTLGPGAVPRNDDQQGPPGLEVAFVRAGGDIGYGADCTPTAVTRIPGFADARALKMLFVQKGFSRLDAIRIATLNGASLLHIDDRTGSIARGKEADLLVVKGDPSVHIQDIEQATMVFSNGIAYDPVVLRSLVRGLYGHPPSRAEAAGSGQ